MPEISRAGHGVDTVMRVAKLIGVAALGSAAGLAACSTTPEPVPPIEFSGLTDVSRTGVKFVLSNSEGLTCSGQIAGPQIPEKFTVPLTCDGTTGSMEAIRAERIEGAISLADGRKGTVTFDVPVVSRPQKKKGRRPPQ